VADGKEEWDAPGLSGDASCCTAPHTCFAEKHHFLVWGRLREAKSVWDGVLFELVGFADINKKA
jgi:hypothetical protein